MSKYIPTYTHKTKLDLHSLPSDVSRDVYTDSYILITLISPSIVSLSSIVTSRLNPQRGHRQAP